MSDTTTEYTHEWDHDKHQGRSCISNLDHHLVFNRDTTDEELENIKHEADATDLGAPETVNYINGLYDDLWLDVVEAVPQ